MRVREPPQHFRFTMNTPVRRVGRPSRGNNYRCNADIWRYPRLFRWFQMRLWRLKWLECLILLWTIIAFAAFNKSQPAGITEILGMLAVSPLVSLMLLAMLKAFVLIAIISSTPLASTIVRQCVYYNDRFLASICEEPITCGKQY